MQGLSQGCGLNKVLKDLGLIILSTALVNNFVLAKFLGLCPVLGVSKKLSTAWGMSVATAFVLTMIAGFSHLLERYIIAPYQLEIFRTLFFILTIAATVQFCELFIRKASPLLHQNLGLYLPLITTNCAVLGLALLVTATPTLFIHSLTYGLGTAIGFSLVLVLFASIREKLAVAPVPFAFQGAPIAFITAGLMALAFMGFS
jgi:electron transport complex protein RnfA